MSEDSSDEVFTDTCVLLNFIQREWERTRSKPLIESEKPEVVVSDAVVTELDNVYERRKDIYDDLVDFLLSEDGRIESYDPESRRIYVGKNDARHIQNIQMELAQLDDSREILRRMRRYLRAAVRRYEFLREDLDDKVIAPVGSLSLEFAIQSVINHSDDATILTDAAGWTANGGSGIFVTLDSEDFLDREEELIDVLREEAGSEWVLSLCTPEAAISKTETDKQ